MSIMSTEDYNKLIEELTTPEITHERKAEIHLSLRENYSKTFDGFTEISSTNEKLNSENKDLLLTNSKYFRLLGTQNQETHQENQENELPSISDLEGELNI